MYFNEFLSELKPSSHRALVLKAPVQAVIDRYTTGRTFGLFGEPRVNVLKVNLALDGKL